jgi:hypothetical protein
MSDALLSPEVTFFPVRASAWLASKELDEKSKKSMSLKSWFIEDVLGREAYFSLADTLQEFVKITRKIFGIFLI